MKGIPIGFIGVTLSDTPSIVIPSGVAGVAFKDEAEAINEAVKQLKRRGVRAIVVLAHNPGVSNKDGSNASGEIVDIAKTVDDEVDVIFAGHNHAYLNAEVDGKLLVQSYSYGTAFSDVDLTIDRRTKDVVAKKAEIVTTYQDSIKPDPKITHLMPESKGAFNSFAKYEKAGSKTLLEPAFLLRFLLEQLNNFNNDVCCFDHVVDGNVFIAAVEVFAARENIWSR